MISLLKPRGFDRDYTVGNRIDLDDEKVAANTIEALGLGATAAGDVGRNIGVLELIERVDVAVEGQVHIAFGKIHQELARFVAASEPGVTYTDRIK